MPYFTAVLLSKRFHRYYFCFKRPFRFENALHIRHTSNYECMFVPVMQMRCDVIPWRSITYSKQSAKCNSSAEVLVGKSLCALDDLVGFD